MTADQLNSSKNENLSVKRPRILLIHRDFNVCKKISSMYAMHAATNDLIEYWTDYTPPTDVLIQDKYALVMIGLPSNCSQREAEIGIRSSSPNTQIILISNQNYNELNKQIDSAISK